MREACTEQHDVPGGEAEVAGGHHPAAHAAVAATYDAVLTEPDQQGVQGERRSGDPRNVTTTSAWSEPIRRAAYRSTSRVPSSAQCRSSTTTTVVGPPASAATSADISRGRGRPPRRPHGTLRPSSRRCPSSAPAPVGWTRHRSSPSTRAGARGHRGVEGPHQRGLPDARLP